jgi:hypothetical protein
VVGEDVAFSQTVSVCVRRSEGRFSGEEIRTEPKITMCLSHSSWKPSAQGDSLKVSMKQLYTVMQ